MRYIPAVIAMVALVALGSCGGRRVTGDISRACAASGRDAASPALCSCVQRVANQTLSASDRRRAVSFFKDPEKAQESRVADGTAAFWTRYRAFTETARAQCSG